MDRKRLPPWLKTKGFKTQIQRDSNYYKIKALVVLVVLFAILRRGSGY